VSLRAVIYPASCLTGCHDGIHSCLT
jgi:hypothetical protein